MTGTDVPATVTHFHLHPQPGDTVQSCVKLKKKKKITVQRFQVYEPIDYFHPNNLINMVYNKEAIRPN